jgi:hypothetical protein
MADLPEKVIDVRIRAREAMEGLSMVLVMGRLTALAEHGLG